METHKGIIAEGDVQISLLQHHLFQRLYMPEIDDVYVTHLFHTEGKDREENKMLAFKKAHAYFLIDGWEKTNFTKNSIQKIMKF